MTTIPAAHLQDLELIGPIVRLQVQTASLKRGEKPHRWFDPAPILAVPALRLDAGGVTGLDDGDIADVHHRDHPHSKFRGENGVSIGFTAHYGKLRARYGDQLVDGIAGENILVDTARILTEADLEHGLVIVGDDGPLALDAVLVAAPCVEFSKFCAGYGRDQRPDRVITETLQLLDDGIRGFYATVATNGVTPARIAVGDLVYRRVASAWRGDSRGSATFQRPNAHATISGNSPAQNGSP